MTDLTSFWLSSLKGVLRTGGPTLRAAASEHQLVPRLLHVHPPFLVAGDRRGTFVAEG